MKNLPLVFLIPLLIIASSCATKKQKGTQLERELGPENQQGLHQEEIEEEESIYNTGNCLPYGQCMPGECGEKPAGCGITMNCGPCPEACPEDQFRSCACMPQDPTDGTHCPCIPMTQHQAGVDNPQPGQANARYVCAKRGSIGSGFAKPTAYRMESQNNGTISFALTLEDPRTQESMLKLNAEFAATALASPWISCLGSSEVTGFAEYQQSSLQNAAKYEIYAMHFKHVDLTGVEQGQFAMTIQVHLRKQDDPADKRTLVLKHVNHTIVLTPPAPAGQSAPQNGQ